MATRIVVDTALFDILNPEGDATIVILAPWGEVYGKYRVNLHTRLRELETLIRDRNEFAPGRLLFISSGKVLPTHASFNFIGVQHDDVFTMGFVIDSTEQRKEEFVDDITILVKEHESHTPPYRFTMPMMAPLGEIFEVFSFHNDPNKRFAFFFQGIPLTGVETPYQFDISQPGWYMTIDAVPRQPTSSSFQTSPLVMIGLKTATSPVSEITFESDGNHSDTEFRGPQQDTPESPVSPVMLNTRLDTTAAATIQKVIPKGTSIQGKTPIITSEPPPSGHKRAALSSHEISEEESTDEISEDESEFAEDSDDNMDGTTMMTDDEHSHHVLRSRDERYKQRTMKKSTPTKSGEEANAKGHRVYYHTMVEEKKHVKENIKKICSHEKVGMGYRFEIQTIMFAEKIWVRGRDLKRLKPEMYEAYIKECNIETSS